MLESGHGEVRKVANFHDGYFLFSWSETEAWKLKTKAPRSDEPTHPGWVRTCYTTAMGQSDIPSVFKPTNPNTSHRLLEPLALEKKLDFMIPDSAPALWMVWSFSVSAARVSISSPPINTFLLWLLPSAPVYTVRDFSTATCCAWVFSCLLIV